MTQQTPPSQLPTPLAVPWTPPTAPAATPTHAVTPNAPQAFTPAQQPAMSPHPQGQAQFQPQNQAQTAQPFQPSQTQPMAQPSTYQGQHHAYGQNSVQAAPHQTQAQIYQQQPSPQAQFRGAQMVAPGHPPMPEIHVHNMEAPVEAPASKSLFKSLLNRKSKGVASDGRAVKSSGSLFDKNFIFGLAAGLVLGFVVIPMVLGGSSEPTYQPVAEIAPTPDIQMAAQEDGETFLDTVLASEEP